MSSQPPEFKDAQDAGGASRSGFGTVPLPGSVPGIDQQQQQQQQYQNPGITAISGSSVGSSTNSNMDEQETDDVRNNKDINVQVEYKQSNQFFALIRKSFIAQKRQYKTNLCQILFPILLIILLFVMQILVDNIIQSDFGGKYRDAILNPTPKRTTFTRYAKNCMNNNLYVNPYVARFSASGPPSEVGSFGNPALGTPGTGLFGAVSMVTDSASALPSIPFRGVNYDFMVQSGDPEACDQLGLALNPVVTNVPNREQFKYDIYSKWGKIDQDYLAAYDFLSLNVTERRAHYVLYYNKTLTHGLDLPTTLNLVSNALFRVIKGDLSPTVFLRNTGVQDYPTGEKEVGFDIISVAGPFIYLYVFQLLLPVFMSNLVLEKELKLREIMKMMGLKTHIYWIVNYLFNFALYLIATFLIIIIAFALGFRVFTDNVFISYFALFFCWGHVMVALGWVLSTLFSSSSTATVVGYLYVFATGILSSTLIQTFFEDNTTSKGVLVLVQVIPSFAFYRGLWALRDGVSFDQPGYTIENLRETDWVPLQEVYIVLLIEWACLVLLAIYLENVVPSDIGVSKSCCYCFVRGESPCLEDVEADKAVDFARNPTNPAQIIDNGDLSLPKDIYFPEDVTRVRNDARNNVNAPVRILDLVKVFNSRDGGTFRAVNNLSMTVNESEV